MATYIYTREILDTGDNKGAWDIDNPDRVDGEGKQIYLANEIKAAIPEKILSVPGVQCNGSECKVNFTEPLSGAEETTLTTTVNNHKNNV